MYYNVYIVVHNLSPYLVNGQFLFLKKWANFELVPKLITDDVLKINML